MSMEFMCSECGSTLSFGDKFCSTCGARVTHVATSEQDLKISKKKNEEKKGKAKLLIVLLIFLTLFFTIILFGIVYVLGILSEDSFVGVTGYNSNNQIVVKNTGKLCFDLSSCNLILNEVYYKEIGDLSCGEEFKTMYVNFTTKTGENFILYDVKCGLDIGRASKVENEKSDKICEKIGYTPEKMVLKCSQGELSWILN